MTKHEKFAQDKGRKLVKIQGRYERWHGDDGAWLYHLGGKRWSKLILLTKPPAGKLNSHFGLPAK